MKRQVQYFDTYGPGNTQDVIQTVAGRLRDGDVSAIVVASTSGRTAVEFARQIGADHPKLVCVSDPPKRTIIPA